jgi:hypothetical protein
LVKLLRAGKIVVQRMRVLLGQPQHQQVATHFKRANETRASEGNDEIALPVVQGASGFAAGIGERCAFVEHRLGVAAQRGRHPHCGEGGCFHALGVMQM